MTQVEIGCLVCCGAEMEAVVWTVLEPCRSTWLFYRCIVDPAHLTTALPVPLANLNVWCPI